MLNISGNDVRGTIEYVRETIRKFDPLHPFVFDFLDDSLDRALRRGQSASRS